MIPTATMSGERREGGMPLPIKGTTNYQAVRTFQTKVVQSKGWLSEGRMDTLHRNHKRSMFHGVWNPKRHQAPESLNSYSTNGRLHPSFSVFRFIWSPQTRIQHRDQIFTPLKDFNNHLFKVTLYIVIECFKRHTSDSLVFIFL